MATEASQFLFLFFLSLLVASCSSDLEREKQKLQIFHLSRKDLLYYIPAALNHDQLINNDPSTPITPITNPVTTPVTNPVTNPVTGPVNLPPGNLSPGIVTVPAGLPATTPSTQTPPTPVSTPLPFPSSTPPPTVTNPVTTPSANPGITGVTPPASASAAPGGPGQSWCVARSGAPETTLQSALDYACGIGGADCSVIQQSGSCYNPNSLQNHASFAFNSYYQKNPVPTSCDFGGAAIITTTNPSSGSCVYPASKSSSSPSSSSPLTQNPTLSPPIMTPTSPSPTPTTASSSGTGLPVSGTPPTFGTGLPTSGTPPTLLNASNPAPTGEMPGFGDAIPLGNSSSTTSLSSSATLKPFVGCIFLVASICTGTLVLKI